MSVRQQEGEQIQAQPCAQRLKCNAVTLLLGAIVVLQVVIVTRSQVLPLRDRVIQVQSTAALERSARLAFGDSFWEYIHCLRALLPEDATVIIPPETVDVALGNEGIMQFYLVLPGDDPGPLQRQRAV